MTILGIDPGLACTGFGIIKVSAKGGSASGGKSQSASWRTKIKGYEMVDYGCLTTSPLAEQGVRLKKIYETIKEIIEKHQPDFCVVEKLFFAKNTKTAMKVGEARGVILLALAEKKISLIELTPLETKMSLTNFGRASKKQIQKIVKLILKLKEIPKPDDAADALALAICGAKLKRNFEP